jgi:hypothetical protein
MSCESCIDGAEKLIAVFGGWPSFHDAEIVSFSIERGFPLRNGHTLAHLVVNITRHKLEYSDDIHYEQVLKKNLLVKFSLLGVCEMNLLDWNHQNVIESIDVTEDESRKTGRIKFDVKSIWGFGGSLRCAAVELASVEVLTNL